MNRVFKGVMEETPEEFGLQISLHSYVCSLGICGGVKKFLSKQLEKRKRLGQPACL